MLRPMGVAVHGIDKAQVKDQDVVICIGRPISLMAVERQSAGAKTIAMDVFDSKLVIAEKMGADFIINSQKMDAAAEVLGRVGQEVDVVVDYTEMPRQSNPGLKCFAKGGRFVMASLPNGDISFDFSNYIIYKEAVVIGVTGRLMYKTWEQCEMILKDEQFNLSTVVGGKFAMKDFEKAFKAILDGVPGKCCLYHN